MFTSSNYIYLTYKKLSLLGSCHTKYILLVHCSLVNTLIYQQLQFFILFKTLNFNVKHLKTMLMWINHIDA